MNFHATIAYSGFHSTFNFVRWRTRPLNQQNAGPEALAKTKVKLEITHPKTPQLTTKSRSRPVTLPSQAELESKIADEMTRYAFSLAGLSDSEIDAGNHLLGRFGLCQLTLCSCTVTKIH